MKFWDLIKIANRNLFRARLRTFLTVMAIFVGSFTLVLTNGLGDGLRNYVENQVKNIEGNNVLFIRKKFEREDEQVKLNEPADNCRAFARFYFEINVFQHIVINAVARKSF